MVHIYTDGSSLGNPGAGGRAAVIHGKKKHALSGFVSHATNNAMELRAVIEALLWIAQQYEVTIPVQQTGTGFFAQSSG